MIISLIYFTFRKKYVWDDFRSFQQITQLSHLYHCIVVLVSSVLFSYFAKRNTRAQWCSSCSYLWKIWVYKNTGHCTRTQLMYPRITLEAFNKISNRFTPKQFYFLHAKCFLFSLVSAWLSQCKRRLDFEEGKKVKLLAYVLYHKNLKASGHICGKCGCSPLSAP
jgi:hypothetical protein